MHNLTAETRKWIYNIALAALVVLSGYGVISAAESTNFANLASAILNIGGVVAVGVARSNVTPDAPTGPNNTVE